MRISNDGFLDFSDKQRVRMPGIDDREPLEPLPEKEALTFLFSHAFRGSRRIVRPLTTGERSALRGAMWSGSVNERMDVVDRVWRAISQPALVAPNGNGETNGQPQLLQIVVYGDEWAYPVVLHNGRTRVMPAGGLPLGELDKSRGAPRIDVRSADEAA